MDCNSPAQAATAPHGLKHPSTDRNTPARAETTSLSGCLSHHVLNKPVTSLWGGGGVGRRVPQPPQNWRESQARWNGAPRSVPVAIPSARQGTGVSGKEGPFSPRCGQGPALPAGAALGIEGVTEEEEEIGPFPLWLQGDISVPSLVTSPGCRPPTHTSLHSLDWPELSGQGLCSDTADLAPSPARERREGAVKPCFTRQPCPVPCAPESRR